ncbi:MAG TPA: amino acid adenylation domain-containing protein [Polyangiales bacterium]|nr:amino acid adenylation domain-containing protein [Polyangiales bacterium]
MHTNYPLTVMGWPDQELGLKISYDSGCVAPAAAERLLQHLHSLLTHMARNSEARIGELLALTEPEREQALVTWNPTPEPPAFASFASLFQAQVARSPRAIAARCADESLSYLELNRRANRVAHALRERGVGLDDRVALVAERGLDLLTMIVATLKLGAAYVPIEPGYPSGRIEHIVRQAGARAVLTVRALAPRLEDLVAALPTSVLALEHALETRSAEHDPTDVATANTLAYVIFTSGSTGRPKGAMVEQQGMLRNMLSKLPWLGLRAGDVIAQSASPCFDISVWQHLTALLFGGTVDILQDEVVRDPARLLAEVAQRGVHVLEVVPAVLAGMLDALGEGAALSLRWVLPTGEALPVPLARAWLQALPQVPLLNAYGPAECSDDVALHALTSAPGPEVRTIPIGRPVEPLRLYVLDPWLAPLPVGVTGELYVGGIGVGRGYLAEPALTAAAYLPDPYGPAGSRLYRTGDLARLRDDGVLEFVGRRDHQVKLRGLRIELGEIESVLAAQPGVREVAVLVREDRPGAQRLVAYLVASAYDEAQLRSALGERVPSYMIPQAFVPLSELPRNANGKLDRKLLPAPELEPSERLLPRDDAERRLAAIWCEVLGVEQVGVTESFFTLGGHSLQLTQVLARVRRAFDVEVSLRSLFEAPTIVAQLRAIEHGPRAQATELRATVGDAPLSFAQERLWFLAQLEPSAASYNIAAAVELHGALDVARLNAAWRTLVERHETLRTRVQPREGELALARTDAQVAALEVEPGENLMERLEHDAATPFELTQGPLARARLFRIDDGHHVLSLVLHHMITDGWSMGVLVRELSALYAGEALAALPIRYGDYARWQREWLAAGELDRQLAFWRERLGHGVPTLRLPTDHPRPEARSYRGARQAWHVKPELASKLRQVARQLGVTPFVVVYAAFEAWLGQRTGMREFAIGTPIANRQREQLEPLIGFLANTLVLRADLRGTPTFVDLVERARGEVLHAQAHQDVPFERLVQALKPARDLGQTPLFQVLLSLQELTAASAEVAGLRLAPLEVDPKTAQFDLSLHVTLEGDAISGLFEYSSDLFSPSTLEAWDRDWTALIEQLLEDPTQAIVLPEPRAVEVRAPRAALAPAAPELEARLAEVWAQVLGRTQVEPGDNFFELGGDSILSLDVVARARRAGVRIQARQMFQYQTLRELAAAAARDAVEGPSGPVEGETKLLPIQKRFFARELANPAHWNQTLLLRAQETIDAKALDAALRALVRQHDSLRLRFPDGQRGVYAQDRDEAVLQTTDLSRLGAQALEQHATRWQASLDLEHGPLLRVVLFVLGEREARLLISAHHLVIDGVSWRVLLDDLEHGYRQALAGEPVVLADKTCSQQRWAEHLREREPAMLDEAARWLRLPWSELRAFPLDDANGDRSEQSMATLDVALDEAETRALLEQVPSRYRTRVDEVLLTAFASALAQYTGHTTSAIEVEGHGRDDDELDLSRSIGWFTSAYPVLLRVPSQRPSEALIAVKEQLRALPRQGLAYGAVRELGSSELSAQLRALPVPELAFNYLGQWDAVFAEGARFALASETFGPEHDPRNALPYELELDVAVHGNKLEASFRHSRARLHEASVQRLGALFLDALRGLIVHCQQPDAGAYSPSDFPDVELSASELDAILQQVD